MTAATNTAPSSATLGESSHSSTPIKSESSITHFDDEDNDKKSIYELRLESSQKLKRAWESIYDKFQDAHLQVQDEIYLGRKSVKGDRMRIIRDRGHLRQLPRTSLQFGCFYLDKAELIGCDMKDEDKPDAGPEASNSLVRVKTEDGSLIDDDDDKHASIPIKAPEREDPDLQEFLKAEAQRRELYGDMEEESEEDERAFDVHNECDDVFGDDNAGECTQNQQWGSQYYANWKDMASSSEDDSEEEDEVRVYSLAQTPSRKQIKKESYKVKLDQDRLSSPLHSSSRERDTPPTSLNSTPSIPTSVKRESLPLRMETPKQSPLRSRKASKNRSTLSKQRVSRVVLPKWEQQSPSVLNRETTECTGLTRCSKSLCMLCGGFKRASKREEETI